MIENRDFVKSETFSKFLALLDYSYKTIDPNIKFYDSKIPDHIENFMNFFKEEHEYPIQTKTNKNNYTITLQDMIQFTKILFSYLKDDDIKKIYVSYDSKQKTITIKDTVKKIAKKY